MKRYIKNFEKGIVWVLLGLLAILLFFSTLELCWLFIKALINYRIGETEILLDISEIIRILGFFFAILIVLELYETVKIYLREHSSIIRVETIMLVAMIAVARKIIVLDYKYTDAITVISIALVIIALSVSYLFLKKASRIKE